MLIRQRRLLWRRFLPGDVVLEALLVAVICSPWRASASASACASFHLHRPGRAWSSDSLRWRILCRRSGLADVLPPSSRWLKVASGGYFAAVVGCSGGCFATFVRPLTFVPWMLLFLLAGSVVGFGLRSGSCPVSFPCCFAVVRVVVVFSHLCVCFQCFSLFSFLCFCGGQALLGHIKIMFVTTSLLMKNEFWHDRESFLVLYCCCFFLDCLLVF